MVKTSSVIVVCPFRENTIHKYLTFMLVELANLDNRYNLENPILDKAELSAQNRNEYKRDEPVLVEKFQILHKIFHHVFSIGVE